MSSPEQDLEITRGDDEEFAFTFSVPVADLTSIRLVVRTGWATTQADDVDAIWVATLAAGDFVAESEFVAVLSVPRAVTLGLLGRVYVYDVEVTIAGKKRTTQHGRIVVADDAGRG